MKRLILTLSTALAELEKEAARLKACLDVAIMRADELRGSHDALLAAAKMAVLVIDGEDSPMVKIPSEEEIESAVNQLKAAIAKSEELARARP